jgi:hypothetical protein
LKPEINLRIKSVLYRLIGNREEESKFIVMRIRSVEYSKRIAPLQIVILQLWSSKAWC